MLLQLGLDLRLIAGKDEAHLRVPDEGKSRRRNDHAWAVVPAHRVERYGDWSSHSPLPIWKIKARHICLGTPGNRTRIDVNAGQ